MTFLSMSLCQEGGNKESKKNYQPSLVLDCANGVGAIAITELMGHAGFEERLKIHMINCESKPDKLNLGCGAEVVKNLKMPEGWTKETHAGMKCVAFDGDADRQIYFYGDHEGSLTVIDGDK